MNSVRNYGFTLYGGLSKDDRTYSERQVDHDLLEDLRAGEYCILLSSKQMGKTSLRNRIVDRLRCDGSDVVEIDIGGDLNNIQRLTDNDIWKEISRQLTEEYHKREQKNADHVEREFENKWEHLYRNVRQPQQKFTKILEEILCKSENKVYFIFDELERIYNLNTYRADNFFAFIKFLLERRNKSENYERVTFCLIGTVAPYKLAIGTTPFNICKYFYLDPFALMEEVKPLTSQLDKELPKTEGAPTAEEYMTKILNRTGGQPFFTQVLCFQLVDSFKGEHANVNQSIDDRLTLCERQLRERLDVRRHFTWIEDYIKERREAIAILNLYKYILENQDGTLNNNFNRNNNAQTALEMSGLVLRHQLRISSPIYKKHFTDDWINTTKDQIRVFSKNFEEWRKPENDKRKECYLVVGERLRQSLDWRERNKDHGFVSTLENDFISQSQTFESRIRSLFDFDQPQAVPDDFVESFARKINEWTSGYGQFNDKIFELIPEYTLNNGDWEEKFHRTIVENIENFRTEELDQNERTFTEEQEEQADDARPLDRWKMISFYREIFEVGFIRYDFNIEEHTRLKDMCFITLNDDDGEPRLKLLNPIYKRLLNRDWINSILGQIKPYRRALANWQQSRQRIPSWADAAPPSDLLLRGTDLRQALAWMEQQPSVPLAELDFILLSLVYERWSEPNQEAVARIIAKNGPIPTASIPAILRWSASSLADLGHILNIVDQSNESADSHQPERWLDRLLRRRLWGLNVNDLYGYLDPSLRSSHYWQTLGDQSNRHLLDRFLAQHSITTEETEVLQSLLKELDNNAFLIYDPYSSSSNDFQKLVSDFLQEKLRKIKTMLNQKDFDALLDGMVTDTRGDLEAVLIFDLTEGLPLYGNRGLRQTNPELYQALFGDSDDGDGGEAIQGFSDLAKMQAALDQFGQRTRREELRYCIFKFAQANMMLYFVNAGIPMAVCFIVAEGVNIGNLRRYGEVNIPKIQENLEAL